MKITVEVSCQSRKAEEIVRLRDEEGWPWKLIERHFDNSRIWLWRLYKAAKADREKMLTKHLRPGQRRPPLLHL